MDRADLAKQTYSTAKVWAEDSQIIQLCEAWIGLKSGGDDYQSAFYTFSELSQGPSANNAIALNGQAVAQAALHRWPEAEAPLAEAAGIVSPLAFDQTAMLTMDQQQDPNHATTLANNAAIALLSGKPAATREQYLE
jgi:coatomer protein complex subunit epsilon